MRHAVDYYRVCRVLNGLAVEASAELHEKRGEGRRSEYGISVGKCFCANDS